MRVIAVALLPVLLGIGPVRAQTARELSVSLDTPINGMSAKGKLRLPAEGEKVRAVIVLVAWALTQNVFEDARWRQFADDTGSALLFAELQGPAQANMPVERQVVRNAPAGGAEGVLTLLQRFADRTGHSELRDAPLFFWGFSAAGNFGSTFAMLHPERTIGFVRFQSNLRGLPMDPKVMRDIPALVIASDADKIAGLEDSQRAWEAGRRIGAPWTFLMQPGRAHGQGLDAATDFVLSWTAGVFRRRLGDGRLRPIDQRTGWRGDNATFEIRAGKGSAVDAVGTSWFPDEGSARLWRAQATASGSNRLALQVTSTVDRSVQKSYLTVPPNPPEGPRPVLVVLHSWSSDNEGRSPTIEAEAAARGWFILAPNFRGPSAHPEGCGSRLAQQDVLDAVA